MSWMKSLYDTYENAIKIDKIRENNDLLKVAHSKQNAQVEVLLSKNGEFISAAFVPKDDAETVIPVTEASASRSSGSAPHALCDKLKYIAGDYKSYTGIDNTKHHDDYMNALYNWVNSSYNHPKAEAVYYYLKNGHIVYDLIESGILSVKEGKLTDKWEKTDIKLSAGKQEDAFVRFRVTGIDEITAIWQDSKLQECYIDYYLKRESKSGLCYVIGDVLPSCNNHPSRIRNSADFAKLISSNDTSGFTYRGRFLNADEAFTISYEASQKAHNALKWIIGKQGKRVGDKVFVLWGIKQEKLPPLITNTIGFMKSAQKDLDTQYDTANKFNNAILGYRCQLDSKSKVTLLGFDAATPGRLSVTYNREYLGLQGNELIDSIKSWHEQCSWKHSYYNEDKKIAYYYGAPSPVDIARVAYGTEQNGDIRCSNEKILANTVERLLPCISDGARVPRDIVNVVVNKSFCPQNYTKVENWYIVLATACSVYRKYLIDYKGEVYDMSINYDCKDISYNCGRLLAAADAIERWAIKDKDKDRTTNAMRFYSRFSKNPCNTWMLINEKLAIYKQQLGAKGSNLYKLIGEISANIDPTEFSKARNLDGKMSLGFDSQRQAIIQDAIDKSNEKKNINGGSEDGSIKE